MLIYKIPLVKDQKITGDINPFFNVSGASPEILNIYSNDSSLSIDTSWHNKRYGFDLPKSDISNYGLHYTAWQSFAAREEDWCLILDESVKLDVSYNDIQDKLQSLAEWDVYFPFDRFQIREQEKELAHQHNNSLMNPNKREYNDFSPFLLGYPWGNSIYFLSKKGALKLLQITCIKQRVDDEIISRSVKKEIDAFFDDVPWFNYNDQPKVISSDRDIDILNAIMTNSRWSDEHKQQIRLILKLVSELAEQLNIDLILQGGTHLGYIRHGGIMPWDDDVDLGIEEQYLEVFLTTMKNNTPLKYGYFIEEYTGFPFYKIWLENGTPIEDYEHTFPFIDLWMYKRVGDDLVFKNGIICPNSAKYPFESVCFEGANFKMTANSIEVLDTRYRTWRSGLRVYNYYHSLEQSKGFALRVAVSVDESGRMIWPDAKNK